MTGQGNHRALRPTPGLTCRSRTSASTNAEASSTPASTWPGIGYVLALEDKVATLQAQLAAR
jgi:hypothetical protein